MMSSNENPNLERTLESAIVVSWQDLMHDAQTGLIHVEYAFAPTGILDYLKVWSSLTRGHWLLVCEYWMSPSPFHATGVRFRNGCKSEGLAHILESVMEHQRGFSLPVDRGCQGLLQISTPTPAESAAAGELVNEAFDRMGSAPAEPAMA
jgi:hypothetical protein